MSTWTAAEAAHLIAWYVFIQWQTSNADSTRVRIAYEKGKRELAKKGMGCQPPGWLFGIAWFFIYLMLTAVAFVYFENSPEASTYRIPIFVLFVVNIVLNKAWSNLYWDWQRVGSALIVMCLLIDTAIATLVLLILDNSFSLWGLCVGLYVPYVAWLLFAGFLNWRWWRAGLRTMATPLRPVEPYQQFLLKK